MDYALYCKFWQLQDFFRNPNQCYDRLQWKKFASVLKLLMKSVIRKCFNILLYYLAFQRRIGHFPKFEIGCCSWKNEEGTFKFRNGDGFPRRRQEILCKIFDEPKFATSSIERFQLQEIYPCAVSHSIPVFAKFCQI